MKKNILKKIIGITILIVCSIIGVFLGNEFRAYQLPYGKKANEKRIKANIPTIKTFMYAGKVNHNTLGNHWFNIREKPKEGEVLHAWKLAITKDENGELHQENDAFRRLNEEGAIEQLNLYTIIDNGRITEQKGKIFEFGKTYEERTIIKGEDLKKLLEGWKID
jgi:hypothetical protein